jgi:hypothetical protein
MASEGDSISLEETISIIKELDGLLQKDEGKRSSRYVIFELLNGRIPQTCRRSARSRRKRANLSH